MSETFINQQSLEDQATYEILARTVQRTYGKQSRIGSANHFLSYTLQNDNTLIARFYSSFTYDERANESEQLRGMRDEAFDFVKKALKPLKEDYENEWKLQLGTKAKKTLSFSMDAKKESSYKEEVEFVQTTMHARFKKAVYKLHLQLKVK